MIAGTHRALLADMYDADALEAINFEQLATVTDRLLFRRDSMPKHRPSVLSFGPLARGSQPYIEQPHIELPIEQTVVIRSVTASRAQVFAVTIVIPVLAGVALGLAALL